MKTEKLAIGSSIYDVDLKNLTPSLIDDLKELLYKNRIIVVKNQQLSEEEYSHFAQTFGFPVPYLQDNYNHPKYPLIFVSSNVKQEGKKIGVPRTGGYWHSDTAFESEPKVLTMLMPKILPKDLVRTTRFIDMAEVYKALPAELINKIEGQEFLHSGRYRFKVRNEDVGLDITEILEMIDYHQPPVAHPAVLVHPVTQEKIVYATSGFTIGIKGKGMDESSEILKSIFAIAEKEQFVKEIRWELGDVIIWDNRFLAHSSGRKKAPTDNIHQEVSKEEETMMYRITLKDEYPLCASLIKEAHPAFN